MGIRHEEEQEIMEKVKKIKKGSCPNFYITGKSVPALENFGFRIADTIVSEKLIVFKGTVKYFTIKLPYFEEKKKVYEFLEHLEDSYSIARDCYDSFEGIILMELAPEWIKNGYNSKFNIISSYLQKYEQVCFIFLVPAVEKKECESMFYADLLKCGICMKIQFNVMEIEECVELFEKKAKESGLEVSKEAGKILAEKLKNKKENGMENCMIVERVLAQILFDRSMGKDSQQSISEQEILSIFGTQNSVTKKKIGFIKDNR